MKIITIGIYKKNMFQVHSVNGAGPNRKAEFLRTFAALVLVYNFVTATGPGRH